MKKVIILTAAVLMAGMTNLRAQVQGFRDVMVGPVAGGGVNWVTQLTGAQKLMPSGYAGFRFIAFRSEHVAWGADVLASSEGYKMYYYGNKETVRPLYLRVPLQGYLFLGDRYSAVRPYINFGPSVAVKLTETSSVEMKDKESVTMHTPLLFKRFDLGFTAGVGVNLQMTERMSLNTGIRYYKGFIDVIGDRADHWNINQNVNANASLLFRIND